MSDLQPAIAGYDDLRDGLKWAVSDCDLLQTREAVTGQKGIDDALSEIREAINDGLDAADPDVRASAYRSQRLLAALERKPTHVRRFEKVRALATGTTRQDKRLTVRVVQLADNSAALVWHKVVFTGPGPFGYPTVGVNFPRDTEAKIADLTGDMDPVDGG